MIANNLSVSASAIRRSFVILQCFSLTAAKESMNSPFNNSGIFMPASLLFCLSYISISKKRVFFNR